MSGSAKSTALTGIVISVLVIAAVASIGYFQFGIAPQLYSSSSTTEVATTTSGLPPVGRYVNVSILSGAATPNAPGFGPATITVVIGHNATVIWTNNDQAPHTVTSTSAPAGGSFDSGNMNPGATFMQNFTIPGTYQYKCNYHYWMTGTVVVKT